MAINYACIPQYAIPTVVTASSSDSKQTQRDRWLSSYIDPANPPQIPHHTSPVPAMSSSHGTTSSHGNGHLESTQPAWPALQVDGGAAVACRRRAARYSLESFYALLMDTVTLHLSGAWLLAPPTQVGSPPGVFPCMQSAASFLSFFFCFRAVVPHICHTHVTQKKAFKMRHCPGCMSARLGPVRESHIDSLLRVVPLQQQPYCTISRHARNYPIMNLSIAARCLGAQGPTAGCCRCPD